MAKRDFAFGKENFILIAVAVAVIAIGFMLMSGGGSQDPTGFNPEIFSSRRIVVAPAVLPCRELPLFMGLFLYSSVSTLPPIRKRLCPSLCTWPCLGGS